MGEHKSPTQAIHNEYKKYKSNIIWIYFHTHEPNIEHD